MADDLFHFAVDAGNTLTKAVVMRASDAAVMERVEADVLLPSDVAPLLSRWKVARAIVASVRGAAQLPIEGWLCEAVSECFRLSHTTPLPVRVQYRTPETLGSDRIAAVVGAYALYPQQNALVIDAGTCLTYDLLTAAGDYVGGNIAPGLEMRLRAMHQFTARLPLVEKQRLNEWVGYSTASAMQVGACRGWQLEVEGFIGFYEKAVGELVTVLTGGDANFFQGQSERKVFLQPDLVFIGLNKILNYNATYVI